MKIHLVDDTTNTAEDMQNWVADIFNDFPYSKKLDFKSPIPKEFLTLFK